MLRVSAGSASIRMAAVGATPTGLAVSGNALTYKNAYVNTRITYHLDGEVVKEDIVLSAAPVADAQAVYRFDLDLEGVTASQRPDGSILFTAPSGAAVFRIPAPFMVDANGEHSDDIGVRLEDRGGGAVRLEVTPSLAWLRAAGRAYPVTVDPAIENLTLSPAESGSQDAWITSDFAGTNYGTSPYLKVGRRDTTGGPWESLVRFPELADLPQDTAIVGSTLRLYAVSGTNGLSVRMRRNTATWDESTVTWSNAPASSSTSYSTKSAAVPGWTGFYMTSLVRRWVRGDLEDFGVRLRSLGLDGEMIDFASSNNSDQALRPELSVTYVPATRLGASDLWTYSGYDHGGGNTSSVNVSTGNLVLTHAGGAVAARGFSVDLTSVYNSQDTYGQDAYYDSAGAWYGDGWTFSQNHRLYELDGGGAVVYKDPSGGADRVYTRNTEASGTEQYHRPLHYGMSLTKDTSATADPKKVYALKPDAGGQVLYFDGGGKIRRIEDRNGNYLEYAYGTDGASVADPDGKLASITDVAGRKTLFEYAGAGGRMSRITDMAGRVHTYEYSAYGNLKRISHWLSPTQALSTEIGYNVGHQLSSVTNPRGHVSVRYHYYKYGWDAAGSADGWAAEANTAASQTAERAFSGSGSLKLSLAGVTSTAAGGASRTFATPVSWNRTEQELTAVVWAPAGYALDARLVLTDGRGTVQTGPLTRVDGGAWTAVRLPSAHVDPAHKISKAEVRLTAPAGAAAYTGPAYVDHLMVRGITAWFQDRSPQHNAVLSHGYDWDGAKTTVKRPNTSGVFQDTTYTYNNYGQVVQTVDPLGNTYYAAYDDDLRLTSTTDPDNRTSKLSYYPNSNEVLTATSPMGEVTRTGVDTATGDLRYEIDPRNEELRASGKEFLAAIVARDANGNVTSAELNRYAAGTDLDQSPLPAPLSTLHSTRYTYGSGGALESITNARGNVTYYSFDNRGYLTRLDSPAGSGESSRRVTTVTPNPDGGISSEVDAKGQKTTYEYDGVGALTRINYGMQDGAADSSVSYTLDQNGNVTAVTDSEGTSGWSYDERDLLTAGSRTQGGVTRTARYAYHANGQIQTLTTFAGEIVTYGYDALGRLVSQSDPKDGGRAITFAYDDRSRLTATTYPSGVSQKLTYNELELVDLMRLVRADGVLLQRFDYEYGLDPATGEPTSEYQGGYVASVSELDGSKVTYAYDDLRRLARAVRTGSNPYDQAYTYDANGNRTSTTVDGATTVAQYDAADQVVKQGATAYTYDRNGNLLSDGSSAYEYDASDKTIKVTTGAGTAVTFGYDGEGARVRRVVGTARTDYWYDQTGMALETGAASATYLRSLGGKLLSLYKGGSLSNYGYDRLGSVTALATGTGSLANTYTYAPYGKEVSSTGTAYNPYRYTGTYQDADTGLYQMGARYYDVDAGRFTQQDPLPGSIAGRDRYGYADGNPVNFTDPSGLLPNPNTTRRNFIASNRTYLGLWEHRYTGRRARNGASAYWEMSRSWTATIESSFGLSYAGASADLGLSLGYTRTYTVGCTTNSSRGTVWQGYMAIGFRKWGYKVWRKVAFTPYGHAGYYWHYKGIGWARTYAYDECGQFRVS